MKLSRRRILHAGCTIVAATLAPHFLDQAEAGINNPGSGATLVIPAFSQRNVINLGFTFDNSYPLINFYLMGAGSTGPFSSAFSTGTTWPAVIDANGWPNQPIAQTFGGSATIPGSNEYTGKWVLTWDGDGTVNLTVGTWTVDAASSSNYVQNANGRYSNATFGVGSSPRVVVTLTGATGPQIVNIQFLSTDPNVVGAYLKNFKFYQLSDETDLLAGKIFRTAFKQSLVNLNPSAIRFLNWMGGSSASDCRFDTRTLPNIAGYSANCNWVASPSYPAATGTNIFAVGVAVPTATNTKTTPVSLTQGEIATVRFTSASVRGGGYTISAISNASSNPQVTTSAAHGLNTNDIVVHYNIVGGTFINLEYFPCKVTVVDATHYTIQSQAGAAINTSGYGTFSSGVATQYWSIDVGARGAKPIAFQTGTAPGSVFGYIITAGGYQTLVYDKNIAILGDGAGNLSHGAWRFVNGTGAWADGPPLEIMVSLINEVNALSVSQGITTPVNMWLSIPHPAMMSMDSDYTTASDFALNAVDVIVNAASSQRSAGYASLTSNAKLFLEYSNETWNFGGGFYAYGYLVRMGYLRWPTSGQSNAVDMYTLRSTIAMRTVKATFGTSRLKYVLAGQGFAGYGIGNLNQLRVEGNTYYLTDSLVTGGSFGRPIDNHDAFCYATYFDSGPFYYGGVGTGSFTDDSAMYAGTAPYGSPNQAQALTNFVNQVLSNTFSDPDAQTVNQYLNGSLSGLTATYAAAMQALGKTAISYEGGPDWHTAIGETTWGSHVITSADRVFLLAAVNSTQWRDAQVAFFNRLSQVTGAAMPSVYVYIGDRWAYSFPDSFGGTATEGQGLLNSPVWVGMGARNQALSS